MGRWKYAHAGMVAEPDAGILFGSEGWGQPQIRSCVVIFAISTATTCFSLLSLLRLLLLDLLLELTSGFASLFSSSASSGVVVSVSSCAVFGWGFWICFGLFCRCLFLCPCLFLCLDWYCFFLLVLCWRICFCLRRRAFRGPSGMIFA